MAGQVSELGKLLITLGVDASRLGDAEKAIKQLRRTAEQEMKIASKALKDAEKAANDLAKATERAMNKAARATEKSMREQAKAMKEAEKAAADLRKAEDREFDAFSKSLHNASKVAGDRLKDINASLERTSNQFQRFGSAATKYLTLPLTLIGGGALKMAADFEQANQKMVALAGVSQQEVDGWQNIQKNIAITTNASLVDIANTLYMVSSTGIEAKEALEITDIAAKAVAIGLGEAATMGKLLAFVINAYGKENITAMQAADALTVSVREGAAEADEITQIIGDLVPVASQLGVSFQEVVGATAAMTNTGFNAFKSSTALRQIMVSLLHPTRQAEKALEGWSEKLNDASYSAEGLRRTMREQGLFEALLKVDDLVNKFGDTSVGIVFGNVRALTGALSLTGENIERVRNIIRMTREETGAFNFAFETMSSTLTFQFGQVKTAASLAFLELGQAMMGPIIPILEGITNKIKALTEWFKRLSPVMQENIMNFAAFLIVVGPVASLIAGIIKMWAGFYTAVILAGRGLLYLNTVMMANPILAVGTAIAALTIYLVQCQQATARLSATQKMANKIADEGRFATIDERIQIESLLRVIKNQNATQQEKANALKTLNSISPEYLGNISEEAVLTGKATEAIETYLSTLERKAKAQAATELLKDLEKKRMQDMLSGADTHIGFWEKARESGLAYAAGLNVIYSKTGLAANELAILARRQDEYVNTKSFLEKMVDDNTIATDSFKTLQEQMALIKSTMSGFETKTEFNTGDYSNLAETQKGIARQLKLEQEYTLYLDQEYNKRLAKDDEYKALKEKNYNAWLKGETEEVKRAIEKQLIARREALQKEFEDRAKANKANILLLETYGTLVKKYMSLVPGMKDLFPNDDDGETKVKTLKQQLGELMELMLTVKEAELPSLAIKYVNLDNQINKQQKLVDLALERVRLNNELNNPTKLPKGFDDPTTTDSEKLEVEKIYNTKGIEFYTNYLKRLTEAEIYFGVEVDKAKMKLLAFNLAAIDNGYEQVLQTIGRESTLMGDSFDATKARIEANNQQIKKLTELYKSLGDEEAKASEAQFKQDVQNLERNNVISSMVVAYNDLELALKNIALYEGALGDSYDSTSAEIQAQQKLLDALTKSLEKARDAHVDYSGIQEKIDRTKSNIAVAKLVKDYEDLNKSLKLIATNEKYLGNTYDETGEQLKAYTDYLNTSIKALNDAKEGTEEYAKAQQSVDDAYVNVALERRTQLMENYTIALEQNAMMERIHGANYNDKIGQLKAEITLFEEMMDLAIDMGWETSELEEILGGLFKDLKWAEGMEEAFNNAKRQLVDLAGVALNAALANEKLAGSLTNIAKGFVQGHALGGVAAIIGEAIGFITDMDKQKLEDIEIQKEMNRHQLEYNLLLNDQMRMEGRKNVFVNDDLSAITKAALALEKSKEGLQSALTYKDPGSGLFTYYKSLEDVMTNLMVVWERKVSGDGLFGTGSHNEYAQILEKYPALYDKTTDRLNTAVADSLLANDNLWQGQASGFKEVLNQLNEWAKQAEENLDALDDATASLVGSMGADMFSAVSEAWSKGENAFLAYEEVVGKGLDNIMQQMIWNAIMAGDLMKLQTDLQASFNPLTGDMDASDDFKRFLDNTKGKIEEVEEAWNEWREQAKNEGFKIPEIEKEVNKAFDSKSIAEKIAKGLEDGYRTTNTVIDGIHTTLLGGFAETFGDVIYNTVFDNFVKAITEGSQMKIFTERLTRYTDIGSEGGENISTYEAAELDKLMANVASSAQWTYMAIKPILDKYRPATSDTSKQLFDVKSIAKTIFDGIDQGLKLGQGSILGDFASGFGKVMSETITKTMLEAVQKTLTDRFMYLFTAYTQTNTAGGASLTLEELIDLETAYANAIKEGQEYYTQLKPILDRYKEQENVEPIDELFDADQIAKNIFNGIDEGLKRGENSLGGFNKGFGDLMRDTLSQNLRDAMSSMITQSLIPKITQFTSISSESGTTISARELDYLKEIYALVIQTGEERYKGLESLFAQFKEGEEIVNESMFDASSIAQTIYDGIDQGLKLGTNSLGGFSSGFGTLLKTTLSKSILEGMTNSLNTGFIKKITEFMQTDSLGGTTLTPDELTTLISLYSTVAAEGTAAFNALKPIWDSLKEIENHEAVKNIVQAESIATSIMQGIKDGFELGQGSLGDFASILETLMTDVLSKAIIQSMTTQLDSVFMKQALSFVDVNSAGGLSITEEERKILDPLLQSVIQSGKALWETFKPIADAYGVDNNQMTKAVGNITQDQASLIAGQFTAMRYDLRDLTDATFRIASVIEQGGGYAFQSLGHLSAISTNTRKTNEEALPELTRAVRETNTLIKELWQ